MYIEHIKQITGCPPEEIKDQLNSILEAIYDHDNYYSPNAVVTWKDLYSILQVQNKVINTIFDKNAELEDERKKLLQYKKYV